MKWKAELGDEVKNVRQELFGPSGKLEGMKIEDLEMGEQDIEAVIATDRGLCPGYTH